MRNLALGDIEGQREFEQLLIHAATQILEAERRVFEDLEFRQIEKEPSLEAEMEDGGRDVEAEAGDVARSWRACRARGRSSPASPSGRRRRSTTSRLSCGSCWWAAEASGTARTAAPGVPKAARVSVWVENNIIKRTT